MNARPRTTGPCVRAALLAVLCVVALVLAGAPLPASAAPGTGALTVILTDPAKQKLGMDRVAVQLLAPDDAVVQTVTTGPRGRATFSGVPVGTTYHLHAERDQDPGLDEVLASDRPAVEVVGGGHVWVVLVMRKGGVVEGNVVTGSRQAFAGVRVTARGRATGFERTVTADVNGHYRVTGMPTDDYTLQFNSRPAGGVVDAATVGWTWSFWHTGKDPLVPASVGVQAEDGAHVASRTRQLNGSVPEGHELTGIVPPQAGADLRGGVLRIAGEQTGASFTSTIGYERPAAAAFVEKLAAGRYRIGVSPAAGTPDSGRTWWWAGDGEPPVSDPSQAAWVVFAGTADSTITFGTVGS